MKLAAILAVLAAGATAQTPDIAAIMERVGRNQADSQELRKQYTFHQKQLLRMHRGNGKVAREEHREYDVSPGAHGVAKELAHFDGRYEYKGMDIDGDLINDLSDDMTNDKHSRDGIGSDLFPLTAEQQGRYNFKLLAAEQYRGRDVYRVAFEPRPHQDFDEAAWKQEVIGHEELFITLHDHLPPEMIYERELLICRI